MKKFHTIFQSHKHNHTKFKPSGCHTARDNPQPKHRAAYPGSHRHSHYLSQVQDSLPPALPPRVLHTCKKATHSQSHHYLQIKRTVSICTPQVSAAHSRTITPSLKGTNAITFTESKATHIPTYNAASDYTHMTRTHPVTSAQSQVLRQ